MLMRNLAEAETKNVQRANMKTIFVNSLNMPLWATLVNNPKGVLVYKYLGQTLVSMMMSLVVRSIEQVVACVTVSASNRKSVRVRVRATH